MREFVTICRDKSCKWIPCEYKCLKIVIFLCVVQHNMFYGISKLFRVSRLMYCSRITREAIDIGQSQYPTGGCGFGDLTISHSSPIVDHHTYAHLSDVKFPTNCSNDFFATHLYMFRNCVVGKWVNVIMSHLLMMLANLTKMLLHTIINYVFRMTCKYTKPWKWIKNSTIKSVRARSQREIL